MSEQPRKIVFGCCFCDKGVEDDTLIGVAHTDAATGEFVQQWFAHQACFRNALAPGARIFKGDEDEIDWEEVTVHPGREEA